MDLCVGKSGELVTVPHKPSSLPYTCCSPPVHSTNNSPPYTMWKKQRGRKVKGRWRRAKEGRRKVKGRWRKVKEGRKERRRTEKRNVNVRFRFRFQCYTPHTHISLHPALSLSFSHTYIYTPAASSMWRCCRSAPASPPGPPPGRPHTLVQERERERERERDVWGEVRCEGVYVLWFEWWGCSCPHLHIITGISRIRWCNHTTHITYHLSTVSTYLHIAAGE